MIDVLINTKGFSFTLDWKELSLKKDIVNKVKLMLDCKDFSEEQEVNGDETEFKFVSKDSIFEEREIVYPF